jgi:hypothetical protein
VIGVEKHDKKRFTKGRVETFLQKKTDKKSKNRFPLDLFYHVFGRFSVGGEGRSRTPSKKIEKRNLALVIIFRPLVLDPTTHHHHGGHRLVFFWRALDVSFFWWCQYNKLCR